MVRKKLISLFILSALLPFVGCKKRTADLRIGYSPNLTHAHALIGIEHGDFANVLGPSKKVKTHVFHAGPSIVEALFAGELDMAYVGPIPAINSFVRSNGEFVVIAGAANGGGAVVAAKGSGIQDLTNVKGKRLVTPQLGNTQDVVARAYFQKDGPTIYPVSNPDQINLFRKGDVDLAWTVEPWVSRLVHETGAVFLKDEMEVWNEWNEPAYPTTVLVVRKSYLSQFKDDVIAFLQLHVELTQWMNENPEEAQQLANAHIEKVLGEPLSPGVLQGAWQRIQFSWVPLKPGLMRNAENAQKIGFLRAKKPKWDDLIDMKPLLEALKITREEE